MIYLDYQATTPLAPEALAAMRPWLETHHANPHSPHRPGRAAKAAVEVARDQVAALLPPGGRVVFTGGATEALNWAIKGTTGPITTVATEHAAVLDTIAAEARRGRPTTIVAVDHGGRPVVSPAKPGAHLENEGNEAPSEVTTTFPTGPRPSLGRETREAGLYAAMLVNNEIGTIHPVAALADAAHETGALFLCDAVQGYGRIPIPANVDLIALSAHKIHGPKGIGALWIRDGITLEPLLHGGDQETGRSGTLSPALCAGFGMAATLMQDRADIDAAHVERLWSLALDRVADGWHLNGPVAARYHGNLNIRKERLDVNRLMSDCRSIAFSAGSACASGSGRSSHVLRAIGLTDAQARSSIRLGFGRYTTEAELIEALDMVATAAEAQTA